MKKIIFPLIELPEQLKMVSKINNGGAGEVFRVKDITGKILALKIINSQWHEKEFLAISALRDLPAHPALTQIFQAGLLADGRLFYTMEIADNISAIPDIEYIPDTLANRINTNKLLFEDILKIFIEIADAVAHLHHNNSWHGDIKPDNIIFINGKPKLADFGTLSADGKSGTAGFCIDNCVSAADRDCYALAKTLYCAWSGLDVSEYPSLPETFNQQEARLIRRIYHKGCSSIPRKRFANATEFITALKKIDAEFYRKSYSKKLLITAGLLFLITALLIIILFIKNNTRKPFSPASNTAEISTMQNIIQAGSILPDDLNGIRPFRNIFESLSQEDLAKLDSEKVQWFKNFYNDRDRLSYIHLQIVEEKNPTKRLALYQATNYKDLYISLAARQMEFDHKFVHSVLRLKFKELQK